MWLGCGSYSRLTIGRDVEQLDMRLKVVRTILSAMKKIRPSQKFSRMTRRQHQRLAVAVTAKIKHLLRCRALLECRVDKELFEVGVTALGGDHGFATWLTSEVRALGWRCPIKVVQTNAGRKTALRILMAIERGVLL